MISYETMIKRMKRMGWSVTTTNVMDDDYHSSHAYWLVEVVRGSEQHRFAKVWLNAAVEEAYRKVRPL